MSRDPKEWPYVPERAKKAVMELLDKGLISSAPIVNKFADDFSDWIDTDFSIPMGNGTSALLSAYWAIGIKPGDEVICPSYTYWATATPASFLGAKIVFAESEQDTFNIDPDDVRKKITDKTKAIVPVHLWGMPAKIDEIVEIGKEKDIPIIEDASHSHGAEFRGKKTGSFGDIAIFSFQATKLMPAGEGGIYLTNNEEYFEKAIALGHYQRTKQLFPDSPYRKYGNTSFGFKFRMSPLHAAIAKVLLEEYEEYNSVITANSIKIIKAISEFPGFVDNTFTDTHIKRVFYEDYVDYDQTKSGITRDSILEATKHLGITGSRYPLLHQEPFFTERFGEPVMEPTERLLDRLVKLPKYRIKADDEINEFLTEFETLYRQLKD